MQEGERYNSFEVLRYETRHKVHVRCSCGYEGTRRADHLESGRTRMCKSCASKETAEKYPPPVHTKSVGDLGGTYYSMLRIGARKRGLEWSVSRDYLWSIFTGRCSVTGREINLSTKLKGSNGTGVDWGSFNASLDRIDSSIGYIEGNVQWVHKEINWFKNSYSMKDFVQMCTEVYQYANQQPSSGKDIRVPEKVQRLGDEESTNNSPTSVQP